MIYLYFASSLPEGGGGRRLMIVRALDRLADRGIEIKECSSFYEAEPYPKSSNPWFYCVVAGVETDLEPIDLLQECKLLEYELGRSRNLPGTPRAIDIDLLAYHDIEDTRMGIQIPHETLTKLKAYLEPIKEIDPDWIHPTSGEGVSELLRNVPPGQEIRRVGEG